MKHDMERKGWAILITYCDGTSNFWSVASNLTPSVWQWYSRWEAVAEASKFNARLGRARVIPEGAAKARVVKVKVPWPEIIS